MKRSRIFKQISFVIALSTMLGGVSSCSNKLDKETLPSVTTTESVVETTETTPEETERTLGSRVSKGDAPR